MTLLLGQARVYLGWAVAGLGQLAGGIRELRAGIALISETGADMGSAFYLCALAEACGAQGEPQEGLAQLESAFTTLARTGSTYQLPELLRVKGELLLALDPCDEQAEGWLRRSLAVAREQGTRASELRAALALARLCTERGRKSEGRDLLAPAYATFDEGFDTPDLTVARSLLQRLA
jgi:predicted ATPase